MVEVRHHTIQIIWAVCLLVSVTVTIFIYQLDKYDNFV